MATAEEWRARGAVAIQELLSREGAATQTEMEAKISDRRAGTWRVQPHHLTTARQRLVEAGVVEVMSEVTRGGRKVTTYHLADHPQKAAERAAARKRLLHARFLSWSDPTGEWRPTPISALEHVVQASLLAAAPHGYRLLRPEGGEVAQLLGLPVPGGSLDNAAFYTGVGLDGAPLPAVVVPVEVKNIRGWVYPSTQELYQLLEKSARLQIAHPDQRFMPVFVCRQMHPYLGRMANHLGFYAINTWRQYIRPVVAADEHGLRLFNEVNFELGYNLELHEGVVQPMVRHFTDLLPKRMPTSTERWSAVAQHPAVLGHLSHLRDDRISRNDRRMTEIELAEAAEEAIGDEATWAPRAAERDDDDEPGYEDWRDED